MYDGEASEDPARVLLERYEFEYKKKYGIRPTIALDGSDRTFCRDLIKQFGADHAENIVKAFIKSENEWFKKKGHSLIALKGNINVVNNEIAKVQRPAEPRIDAQLMSKLDAGIWQFKNSKMVRDTYKCTKDMNGKFYDESNKELEELDIHRLVAKRII